MRRWHLAGRACNTAGPVLKTQQCHNGSCGVAAAADIGFTESRIHMSIQGIRNAAQQYDLRFSLADERRNIDTSD